MSLLECLVGIALCTILLTPLLKTSADLAIKQIEYEKTQAITSEAERALELIGRAIRMAGYRNIESINRKSTTRKSTKKDTNSAIEIRKASGYRGSDSVMIRHELSAGVDFDCIGNILSADRTKNQLAYQGFLVDRQASLPKGMKSNGGSLICQSLDRQGRIQNTTLMNGVNTLRVEELEDPSAHGQRAFKVRLQMTDGVNLHREYERTFATRNLL